MQTQTFSATVPKHSKNRGFCRYSFNGKEKDDEVYGVDGSFQDYGMRMYDTRVCRFISVDPITSKYPMLTPYQFASNTTIQAIDLDGAEVYHYLLIDNSSGGTELLLISVENTRTIAGIKYTPELAYHVYYYGNTYSFGDGTALNCIGKTPQEAFLEFVENPNDGKWLSDKAVESLRDEIISASQALASISKFVISKISKEATSQLNNAVKNNSENSPTGYENLSDSQLSRAKGKYERLIKEHKTKLDKFKDDPEGQTDPTLLKTVKEKAPDKLKSLFEGRVKALEKQINKQVNELNKIIKETNKRKSK